MRKLKKDYGPTTHELRKNYGHITDGNYSVLHHFYDYVYSVIRCATLTFFWPLLYVVMDAHLKFFFKWALHFSTLAVKLFSSGTKLF